MIGSEGKPWHSVEYALSKVAGGHTIIVKPGLYRGPTEIAGQYAGTKEQPTVIRSEAKWKAVIVGAPHHGIKSFADWIVVDGFEALGARYDGIKMEGGYNAARGSWVHNNSHMGIAMRRRKGGIIEDNLVEFNAATFSSITASMRRVMA